MKLHFNIEYKTNWGENLRLILSNILADGSKAVKEYPLNTTDGLWWNCVVELSQGCLQGVEYKYALYEGDTLVWTEWEVAPHRLDFDPRVTGYLIYDTWRPIPDDLPMYSSAFTECVGRHEQQSVETLFPQTLQLRTLQPHLRTGEYLAIVGNTPQFGEWLRPLRMNRIALQEWAVNIDAALLFNQAEYKYVIVDSSNNIIRWEDGVNRTISSPQLQNGQLWIKTDHTPLFGVANWKCAGVVIPVFSLRSSKSYGVGDFGDLKALVKWAVRTDMHAIQILPINDTTKTYASSDSYPYNAISIYALHPIYCDLNALSRLDDKLSMEKFMMRQQELNSLPYLDYDAVIHLKFDYLRLLFRQEGKEVLKSEAFKDFFNDNADWLMPYAAFCYLRDKFGTARFSDWTEHRVYDRVNIKKLCDETSKAYEEISLHYYIQYLLHIQLLDACRTARANGVIIKGDIPIGISPDSVEAWTEPHLFNLDGQAGAPPDDFSVNGQNWGFPTYNWDAMAKDGYAWWVRRFRKMAEYFDAYRIDHVLGFFRIWEIPTDSVHGLLGQFSPSMPMTVKEIEQYGWTFNEQRMTTPYITDEVLDAVFGYKRELVSLLYLNPIGEGRYALKPEFDTQRKIQAAFALKGDRENDIRDGLYSLVSNVLFVRDRKNPYVYHPRIAAQNDYAYRLSLADYEKDAFNRLYNDYYYKRHNEFWYREAMKKLPILTQATRMLVCAEDLGMVPDCVQWVMQRLRILSLEIQTMPKAYGVEFGQLQDNPYRSVATISTHDMSPLRLWWEEDYDRAQRFYNNALHKDGTAPHVLPGWLCEDVVSRHLFSPSILCLLSFQDWLSIDERLRHPQPSAERINIPADADNYWKYRMHLTIEQLLSANVLNDNIKTLIDRSGRQ